MLTRELHVLDVVRMPSGNLASVRYLRGRGLDAYAELRYLSDDGSLGEAFEMRTKVLHRYAEIIDMPAEPATVGLAARKRTRRSNRGEVPIIKLTPMLEWSNNLRPRKRLPHNKPANP